MKAYDLAWKEIGTVEWKAGSNPKVLDYYDDAGAIGISNDDVPWCAAFVGAMLKRAGGKGTGRLDARSYLKWGKPVDIAEARTGDIVVFRRGNSSWQGHVAFFVRRAGAMIEVVGGNQSDSVSVARYPIGSLLGVRREIGLASKPVVDTKPANPVVKTDWLSSLMAKFAAMFKKG